jgi:hypothetical protein
MANYEPDRDNHRTPRTDHQRGHVLDASRPFRVGGMGHPVRNQMGSENGEGTPKVPHRFDRSVSGSCRNPGRGGTVPRVRHQKRYRGSHVKGCCGPVYGGGHGFPYRAVTEFHHGLKENWRHLRAVFALDGIDWRGWSAADRTAIAYLLLKRQHHNNPTVLRELYELAGDTAALAELGRQGMGQDSTIETTR